MPSVEAKIQKYLNFSKGKSSSKEALKDIGCATAGAVAGAVAGVATLNKDVAESVSNKVNDKCNDKVDSIFKNSNHELKDKPLK